MNRSEDKLFNHPWIKEIFTMLGFPKYSREDMSDPKFKEENPLVLSGKFIRDKSTGSADMTEETREKLYSVFPDIPIITALSMNEIDPDYLGVLWIRSCSSRFYRRLHQEVKRGEKGSGEDTSEKLAKSREIVIENLRTHPYIKIVELNGSIEMKDAFYNEIMMLEQANIDELLCIRDERAVLMFYDEAGRYRINAVNMIQ